MTFKEFLHLKKSLKNSEGISYLDFINTLKPNYFNVWRDVCFGYLAWILSMYLSLYALRAGIPAGIVIFIGAFFVGYWFHYISTFYHAAAHCNLHPSRKWNDRLANLLFSVWIGMDI